MLGRRLFGEDLFLVNLSNNGVDNADGHDHGGINKDVAVAVVAKVVQPVAVEHEDEQVGAVADGADHAGLQDL